MNTALIVIDVQQEYFSGAMPIEFPPRDESLAAILAAMDAATSAGVPVVVVRHSEAPSEGVFQPGTPGHELLPEIADRPRDLLIDKQVPGTFTDTELEAWLKARNIAHITIVGYMTNFCCDTTARQAVHLGLGATMLHDAVGVPSMETFDGSMVPAETLHSAALAPLALMGVELLATADWVAGL